VRRPLSAFAAFAAFAAPAAAFLAAGAVACVAGGRVTVTVAPEADATAAGPDAAVDAAVDAAEELVVGDECGHAPYVKLGIVVMGLTLAAPQGAPVAGARLTSPLCPGIESFSDDAGVIQGYVSQNVAFYSRLQAPFFLDELLPEELIDADTTGNVVEMLTSGLEPILLPGFDASAQAAIVISAGAVDADAGPCSSLDGISFSVPGHPEAQTTYFSTTAIPQPVAGATATTTRGLAAITGLAAGQYVEPAGTKAGCTVAFKHGSLTGRVALENGFISLTPAYLSP
jgi:hypothetical protein